MFLYEEKVSLLLLVPVNLLTPGIVAVLQSRIQTLLFKHLVHMCMYVCMIVCV